MSNNSKQYQKTRMRKSGKQCNWCGKYFYKSNIKKIEWLFNTYACLICFDCNVKRIDRINKRFEELKK
jgi:hypothetical protein